jgi:hypothetical protein
MARAAYTVGPSASVTRAHLAADYDPKRSNSDRLAGGRLTNFRDTGIIDAFHYRSELRGTRLGAFLAMRFRVFVDARSLDAL